MINSWPILIIRLIKNIIENFYFKSMRSLSFYCHKLDKNMFIFLLNYFAILLAKALLITRKILLPRAERVTLLYTVLCIL